MPETQCTRIRGCCPSGCSRSPFGRPDQLLFWGRRLSGGDEPLFLALLPGLLAFSLVAASGRRGRGGWWGWGLATVRLGLAAAESIPLLRGLFALPGAALFRFPVKFWLLTSLGMSLLGGIGARRLLASGGRRAAGIALAFGGLLFGIVWGLAALSPERVGQWMAGVAGDSLTSGQVEREVSRWEALGLLGLALSLLLAAGFADLAVAPKLGLAGLLAIHAASQILLLGPALATAETAELRQLPPMAAQLPAGATVVSAASDSALFHGPGEASLRLPSATAVWLARFRHLSLAPWSGQLHRNSLGS